MELEDKVKRARKGDDDAFYELISERKEVLYRTAFIYAKNKDDALDIVNETVYRAYISIKKLKEPGFFYTWLTRILINCSIDHLRKAKNVVPFNEEADMDEAVAEEDTEGKLDLYSAVDKLEGKYKDIVILKYFHDMTLAQAAEVLDCPVGTAKTYLHKALGRLRLELKEEF